MILKTGYNINELKTLEGHSRRHMKFAAKT